MGEQVIADFVTRLRNSFPDVRVILFGSRARGDHLESSDYDLIIISKTFEDIPFIYRPAHIYPFWDLDQDVEPLCYTPKEFERKQKHLGIVRVAVQEGLEVKLPASTHG